MQSIRQICTVGMVLLLAGRAATAEVEPRIPADAEVVVSVNVAQILSSPLGAKYVRTAIAEALKQNPEAQEVLNYIGLDPMHDIGRLTVAMASAKNKDGLVVVRGKFDRAKIGDLAEKVAADQKGKIAIHRQGSATIYELAGEKKSFAMFPDESTLLIATSRDRLTSPAGQPKAELLALIAKADGRQAIWFVASPDATGEIKGGDDALKKLVDSLVGAIGTVKLESSIRLEVALLNKSAQSAAASAQTIIDFVGFAKVLAPQAIKEKPALAPLGEVINSIRAATRDKLVVVTAEISAEQIEKAIKSLRENK